MPQPIDLDHLSDSSVLLIFSRLTQELRSQLTPEDVDALDSEDEVRELIGTLAARFAADLNQPEPVTTLPDSASAGAIARQVLPLLARDDTLRPRIAALVERPPRDRQISLDQEAAVPIILSTIAAWLQTRLKIEYGETESQEPFQVDLASSQVDLQVVKDVIKASLELIRALD